ncbi:MAG: hypothetical protein WCP92_05585 [bacterium]
MYKKYFAEILAKDIDLPLEEILTMIEIPPENIPGDLAFPCFPLAKQAKTNPNALAQQFADKFSSPYFSQFEAIGGYVNAHINQSDFITIFFSLKPEASSLKPKEKVLIEYMSANPNKPLHI